MTTFCLLKKHFQRECYLIKGVMLINQCGAWDIDSVSSFLPLSALLEILAYHVPNLLGGADRPIWGLTPDDLFSVKSIYDALNNSGQRNGFNHSFV